MTAPPGSSFAAPRAAERAPFDPDTFEPFTMGPTWQRTEAGKWHLPKYTLGWQIAGWCAEYLRGMNSERDPWRFTPEQLRWLLWWYAVDDDGRFIYQTGTLQRLKGWGKDPLAAVLCMIEAFGPSRFSHWGDDGQPVGMPKPGERWIQIAAVSQTQTRNTMRVFPSLMTRRLIDTYNIKPGAELIRGLGGQVHIEAVTSNYRALEGGRSTFVILNETHHWVSGNHGHLMYETIDGNTTKMDGRYLAITNAYMPGEDSVAERIREEYEDFLEGRGPDVGMMYDTLEAPPGAPMGPAEVVVKVVERIRGDAKWLNPAAILKSMRKKSIGEARSRRMWYNQIVADEDALLSREDWDVLGRDAELNPGDEIVLGFDGGKSDDGTALVAIRIRDKMAFLLGYWQAPDTEEGKNWVVPREQCDSAVMEAHALYKVRAFYADVNLWESYIAQWEAKYGDAYGVKSGQGIIGWDMRHVKRATHAHVRFLQTLLDGKLFHDGNPTLRRHALNARRWANDFGVSFRKESRESPRKVDCYAALMLAHEALTDYLTRGKKVRERTGRGYFL